SSARAKFAVSLDFLAPRGIVWNEQGNSLPACACPAALSVGSKAKFEHGSQPECLSARSRIAKQPERRAAVVTTSRYPSKLEAALDAARRGIPRGRARISNERSSSERYLGATATTTAFR